MAAPAGIAGQLGFKSESTVGTGVTVDQFHEGLLPGAVITQEIVPVWSSGIRAGRRTRAAVKQGSKPVTGSIPLELWSEPAATLLRHMFGTIATTGSGPTYTHTASPGDLTGQALTVQLGLPGTGGTVHPVTAAGCKISEWTINVDADSSDPVSLDLSLVGMTTTTGTALASASYGSGAPFVFTEGSLSIASSEVATVRSASLTGNNNISPRVRLNSSASKEPLQVGMGEYTGTVSADFEDLTAYNRFINGTAAELILKVDNGTDSLTFTCNVWFTGETPSLTDGILEQPLPFTCYHATADDSAIEAVLVNGESAST